MLIAVGSRNPIKLAAVLEAFQSIWPDKSWQVVGTDIKSGVSDQPMSDKESLKGATSRATQALQQTSADYGVGLEGGLQEIDGIWYDCGWIVITSKEGLTGRGSTIRMEVSPQIMELIDQGKELGTANDIIFKTENSKQANGHFGLMTNDVITRQQGYRDGVIAALARFVQPQVY